MDKRVEGRKWLPAAVILCIVVALLIARSRYQHTSSIRPDGRYSRTMPQFHSSTDEDGDGISDYNGGGYGKNVFDENDFLDDEFGSDEFDPFPPDLPVFE